ncbi:MAG: HAD family hydrolase [Candidatus Cryptobacteroides sp.]|nr:haloacid dehalogenase-like hydrolase [Bacteroidales bacterium]MDY2706162.1 HAD family hydrolase [Candidatus Cryptobacteroides sp.]MCI6315125.1 haloacid dehalogenase-like hydrolase [Bacteroidales bacterium]MCI7749757.1 haloacid dehalogenase-like hydrolase [Bacteroidales bacterium]MDD6113624.1 HAD family hydrolase [Bacteroidales bacterium]
MKKPIVALIYDFDGTLSPGNMQEFGFIQAIEKSPEKFWKMSDEIAIDQDASNILSYMKLMFDEARNKGIRLRKKDFQNFGRKVELFSGVKEWFQLTKRYGKEHGVTVEHYINSSGLAEIIEGTPIAGEFKRIFACSFLYDENGEAVWPGVAVDYTAKTQFLFKINKGILSIRDNKLVNESQSEDKKRIPFPHMVYFGDGQTDVPCMKIVKMFGGHSIAVYNPEIPGKKASAKKLLKQERVNFIAPAEYTEDSLNYKIVCSIIDKIKADYELQRLKSAR